MQPPWPTGPARQGLPKRGGGGRLPPRVVPVGGQQQRWAGGPPWPGSEHIPQWSTGEHTAQWPGVGGILQVPSGDDLGLPGDLQGGVQHRPAMAALAGDDPSADEDANGNSFGNGNGYFSNMMMDESNVGDFDNYGNSYADQQSQSLQVSPAVPSSRPNHKRSKNFSNHEDEVLVSARLNISLDPVVGKDQKGSSYWSRICDYFHEHKTCSSVRTINSLMHRWETIQKIVNKFCGCLTRIELRRQSGSTMQDKVAEACALYKGEDQHSKSFQFMHCWNKLRTQPKWLAKLDELADAKAPNKRQKVSTTGDAGSGQPSEMGQDVVEGEANALTRPIGKKKAKAALLQEKKKSVTATLENMWAQKKETDGEKEVKKDERFNKAFALEQERVANEKLLIEVRKQEVELQKRRDEERIMTMDLTAMPDDQKKYYMCLRAEIMSRIVI